MSRAPAKLAEVLAAGAPGYRLVLAHGPEQGTARSHADALFASRGDGAERVRLDGDTLKRDPARLVDEASSIAMFAPARVIEVVGNDEVAEAVRLLLAAPAVEHPVIVLADAPRKNGALMTLSSDPAVLALPCEKLGEADGARFISREGGAMGVQLDQARAARIWEAAGGERSIGLSELRKIALYLDAAPDRPRVADDDVLEAMLAVSGLAENPQLVAQIAFSSPQTLPKALEEITEASAIGLLRAVASKHLRDLRFGKGNRDSGQKVEEVAMLDDALRQSRNAGPVLMRQAITRAALRR